MQGQKLPLEPELFIYGDPYEHVPRHCFWEALSQHLDLEWVRAATVGLYAPGIGRPSLDPVVFVKVCLVAFFENITQDSQLAFRIADSCTIRRFLGYGLCEDTPERTTILKTRARWPEEVFAAIFVRVLEQLKQAGLVKGEHLGTDTMLVDANASMDSLIHRTFGCTYWEFVRALYSQAGAAEAAAKDAKRPGKAYNDEWVSTTDPEAAVAVHPDRHTALSYRVDGTVDLETGAIVAVGVMPGNVRDSEDLPQRLEEASANLEAVGLEPQDFTADRGHHSVDNLVEAEELGIEPIIRERRAAGPEGFRADDFTYVPQDNVYVCPGGQRLAYAGEDRTGRRRRYRAQAKLCRACLRASPHRQRCEHFGVCTKSEGGRTVFISANQEAIERNRQRRWSPLGSLALRWHRQRAEAIWSYLKNYGGLARLSARGIANALKKALVAAIGWNLMLLVAHQTGLPVRGRTQTGLTPRGRSARSEALVYVGACIGHLLALGALVVSSYRRFRHLLRPLPTFRPLPRINPRVALSRGC